MCCGQKNVSALCKSGLRVISAKDREDDPDCYQHKMQKLASVMVWQCMNDLLVDTANVEVYTGMLERHNIFFWEVILHVLTSHERHNCNSVAW